jgi:Ca2+-binding RTX toxin-like protein
MFDNLEDRRLMSATLVGNELQVIGSNAVNDVIKVSQLDAATIRVEENGVVTFYNDANVQKILLRGLGGNDRLEVISTVALPLYENVKIEGGDGHDTVRGGAGNDSLDGGAGNDLIYGGVGNDTVTDGAGDDTCYGSEGDDKFVNGAGRDVFNGNAGVDLVDYSAVTALPVLVSLDGVANDGAWFLVSEQDNCQTDVENVNGGAKDDVITGQTAVGVDNVFNGGAGNDLLDGRGGNDGLYGGDGNDTLRGGNNADKLGGGKGNDQLLGGKGDDTCQGGDNDDVIVGGAGIDNLWGDSGNDLVVSTDGQKDNWVDGGLGNDTVDKDDNDPNGGFEVFA